MGNLLLQKSWDSPMDWVSTTSNDVKKSSALSRTETLSIGGMILTRALMPLVTTTAKYGAIGYAIHELWKQSHTINAIESLGVGIITWMGTPFAHLYEKGFSSESVASLLIVGVVGFALFFARSSKFNFIGKDIARLIGDAWFSFQYLGKTFAQYRKDGDKKSLKKRLRKYFSFFSLWLDYFSLTKLERELVLSGNLDIVGVYMKVAEYFHKTHNAGIVWFHNKTEDGLIELRFYRPVNMKEEALIKLSKNDLLHSIGLDINEYSLDIFVWNEITIQLMRKQDKKEVRLNDYLSQMLPSTRYLGVNEKRVLISDPIQLSHANHVGVFWSTWTGKSIFTSGLLYSLYLSNPTWSFSVADIKWDFSFAQDVKRIRYASDLDEILQLLDQKVMHVQSIHSELKQLRLANLEEYFKNIPEKEWKPFMKPEVLFIEEYSYLLDLTRELAWTAHANLVMNTRTLIQIGRSAGYSLVLSLQKPLAESVWSTIIKDMLKVISFRASSTGEVLAFWEKTGLELDKLEIGEAVHLHNGKYQKFRTFNVDSTTLKTLKDNFFSFGKSLPKDYLSYARSVWRFCFDDADSYGLSRKQFDTLSKKCQEDWILIKRSNNSLEFTD
jgi:hypothetical protein